MEKDKEIKILEEKYYSNRLKKWVPFTTQEEMDEDYNRWAMGPEELTRFCKEKNIDTDKVIDSFDVIKDGTPIGGSMRAILKEYKKGVKHDK